jgi:hypothetical protein
MVFNNFACLLVEKIKNRVSHWFYKNTFEIPPKTLYSEIRTWLNKNLPKTALSWKLFREQPKTWAWWFVFWLSKGIFISWPIPFREMLPVFATYQPPRSYRTYRIKWNLVWQYANDEAPPPPSFFLHTAPMCCTNIKTHSGPRVAKAKLTSVGGDY